MVELSDEALGEITSRTLGHYQTSAENFWMGTRDHDVSQNIEALLSHIEAEAPYRVLDFGCGPGRDVMAFKTRGHEPVGLDGAQEFCAMARKYTGCEVLHQDFLALDLPSESFDGVFANASLFHVPAQELPRVLLELHAALKEGGVLFASNPRGRNSEGWHGERYGAYHDLERWRTFMENAGFVELVHYYRPPGLPRVEQPWLASAWRKLKRA